MILKLDNIVIGGNLKALQFALKKGYPIVYKELELPFQFEQIDSVFTKREYVEYMAFLISAAGLNYFGNKIENITVTGNELTVSGKRPWLYTIEVKNIYDFRVDENNYTGLYQVADWINIRSCGLHSVTHLDEYSEDGFVNKIIFYPSQRQNKSKLFYQSDADYESIPKDLVSLSFLTREQLNDESYSPVYSRLKTLELLKKNGLKGKKVGFSSTGKPSTAPIKLEFEKREVFFFDSTPIFVDLTSENAYVRKIIKYFTQCKKN